MGCLYPPRSDCNLYGNHLAMALPPGWDDANANANGGTDSTLDTRGLSFACYVKDASTLVRGVPFVINCINAPFLFVLLRPLCPSTRMHACVHEVPVCMVHGVCAARTHRTHVALAVDVCVCDGTCVCVCAAAAGIGPQERACRVLK